MRRVNLSRTVGALLILLSCTAITAQGEIYQWTDAEGKTHFGSKPPTSGESPVTRVTNLPPPRFRPELDGGVIRCGKLAISWPSGPVDRYVLTVAGMIQSQREAVASGDGDDVTDMRRCLIGWLEGQLRENRPTLELMRDEYRQHLADLKQLAEEKQACPNPAGGWLVGDEARDWLACHEPRDKAMSRKEDRIRKLRPLKPFWESLPAASPR